jgi:glycosyltransferase involved in cell wall biosynthesis
MRAVLATRIFSPEPAAAAFRLTALANALADDGHEVVVLTGRIRGRTGTDVDPAVRVSRWPVLRDASGTVRGYLPYLSFDLPLAFRLAFRARPDVVIAEPPPTTGFVVRAICAMRRVPYVYYAADVWSEALKSTPVPGWLRRAVSGLERGVLRRAALVVAVSAGVAEAVRSIADGAAVEVVANGVDTSVFEPDGPVASSGDYLVYAGTTSEWQGAEVFVEALARARTRHPGLRVVFLGQGSAWESLRAAAEEAGIGDAIDFRGVLPAAEAAAWLRGARTSLVSLRPGAGYDFAVPTKILASVAVGTPVLFAGPSGPAADLVRDSRLGVVVRYDAGAVADAMVEAVEARPDRARLRAWAVESASIAATGRRVAELVADVGRSRLAS